MKNIFPTLRHVSLTRVHSRPVQAAADINDVRPKQSKEHRAQRGAERILMTENNRFFRTLVGTMLYRAGYAIIEALDGEDAVRKFWNSREVIDLLLLDMDMPKKSGKEVYDEIRNANPDIKVLFASAYPGEILQKRGLIAEGTPFLSKPFGPQLLLEKIREALDGPPGVGDLTVF